MNATSDDPRARALLDEYEVAAATDRDSLVDAVVEAEQAQRTLADHLAVLVGGPIRVRLAPCPDIEGTLLRVGRDHLWIGDVEGFWLVVTAEADGILGWQKRTGPGVTSCVGGSALGSALREFIGPGVEVSVLVGDRWFTGRRGVVGADFVEVEGVAISLGRVRACRVWY